MDASRRITELLDFYRSELLDNIIPWWMRHAVDWENGGVYQFIEDDGTVVSEDKYMWSQLRALYTWSALYNRIARRYEWLEVANNVYEFIMRVGRDEQGQWVYWVDKNGNVKEGANSIYTDGFAIMGLTEYARATGDERAVETAMETFHSVQQRLAEPGSYLTAPYTVPEGAKAHGISMLYSTVFHEFGKLVADPEVLQAGYAHAMQIMDHFRKPERRLLLEYVKLDGSELDSPEGRAVVPGHAIESMWFLINIFRDRREPRRIDQAVECIRWHMEASWDPQFGGMFLAVDAEGNEQVAWEHHEKKFWWPHTEALVALLMAYEHSGEPWCLHWHQRLHEWAYAEFPVRQHGEWHMRLDREGNVPKELLSLLPLPIKDPFHLPRALIMCIDVLERLTGQRR